MFGKLGLLWKLYKLFGKAQGLIESMRKGNNGMDPRPTWRTKRFREGVAMIVVFVLAMIAGDVTGGLGGIIDWVKGSWDMLSYIGLALYFTFAGAGQSRTEKLIANGNGK